MAKRQRVTTPAVKAMDVSTAHMPASEPEFGQIRHVAHEYGYMVFVPGREAEDDSRTPDWLKPLLNYAWNQHCLFLNFDRDGDRFEEFTQYDW